MTLFSDFPEEKKSYHLILLEYIFSLIMNLLFQCICYRKLRLILVKSSILGKTEEKKVLKKKNKPTLKEKTNTVPPVSQIMPW